MSWWVVVLLTALAAGSCTPAFWDRPGADRLARARDTEACYRGALGAPLPAALPSATAAAPSALGDQPPPALWGRAPSEAGFARFDEQLQYDRCMRDLGYRPTRPAR
jgi:hypothetical protein